MDERRRRLLGLSGGALAGAFLAGCVGAPRGGDPDPARNQPTTDPSAVSLGTVASEKERRDPNVGADAVETLAHHNAAFGFDLLGELVAGEPGENQFASPYSVSVALAMTCAGAQGDTRSQMRDALRFPFDDDRLHGAFNALDRAVESRADAETDGDGDPFSLATANSVWGLPDYPYLAAYLDTLAVHYGAGLKTVDFRGDPEAARERVNAWVADHTDGEIEDLLPEGSITPLTRLVLTNAVYFEANWAHTFDEDATEDREFTALDGSTATVPTMHQKETFPYAEVDGAQVVDLPYVGGDVAMTVVLPPEGEFESFEREFDADRLTDLAGALEPTEGEVALPKFGFGSKFSLPDALSALGMPVAFDPERANLDGMIEGEGTDLYVKDVVHQARVTVDEEGTEAAAATGVVVNTVSYTPQQFEMTVDRPFLFLIRDRPTGAVLFLGRVVDAVAAQP